MPALITWWTLDVRALHPEAHDDAVAAVGADLLRRWSEPHRRYHTTTHLVEMFWALDELLDAGELAEHEGAVARIAAWFHDARYDPRARSGSNETESAEMAVRELTSLGVPARDRDAVERLVRLTDGHQLPSDDGLAACFHDADLWILSAPPDRFGAYCEQVRQEYAFVDDTAYAEGRSAILVPFERRDHLYRTAHARQHWDDAARLNLGHELARLRGGDEHHTG
jgi:predicted metal-dependent HD superfamily phosphohydrolase